MHRGGTYTTDQETPSLLQELSEQLSCNRRVDLMESWNATSLKSLRAQRSFHVLYFSIWLRDRNGSLCFTWSQTREFTWSSFIRRWLENLLHRSIVSEMKNWHKAPSLPIKNPWECRVHILWQLNLSWSTAVARTLNTCMDKYCHLSDLT